MRQTTEDVVINTTVLVVMVSASLSIIYPFWRMIVDSVSTPAASIKMAPAKVTEAWMITGGATLGAM